MSNQAPKNIVIRCPNWVGDLVMCTPALRSIRKRFPDATITAIVRPAIKQVIEYLPFIDAIIEYDKRRDRGIKNYLSFIKKLRSKHFDLGIALTSSFSSALLLFLSSIPIRVGYNRNGRGFLLTSKKEPLRENGKIVPTNKVQLYLGLSDFLGCTELSTRPELKTSSSAEAWVDRFFAEHSIKDRDFIVGIIPGSSFGPSKCWKEESFAKVADALIKIYGARILILPGPGEIERAHAIMQKMKESPVDMDDTIVPIDILMALIRRCSLLITNDTGPRHFAVAFDKPVIVLMGPTDSRHTDCNLEKTIILQEKVDCGPCHLRECPTDHRCMILIIPEKVLTAVHHMIDKFHLTREEP